METVEQQCTCQLVAQFWVGRRWPGEVHGNIDTHTHSPKGARTLTHTLTDCEASVPDEAASATSD